MLFNSLSFAVFFPTVFFAFFLLPTRYQWLVLLCASAYFYMAFVPWYILVLIFLILVDYGAGRAIERAPVHRRKTFLIVSIICNLGTLFLFKYFNFFNENIAHLAHAIGWNYSIASLQLILPIGLSFHVFQSLSYVIEVYRGKQKAERSIGIYALYVLFFPQLVAGPIERPQHLLPQLHQVKTFDAARAFDGLTLMLWGFFKKLVIADQLAVIVDRGYADVYHADPTTLLIAVILFAYQLYCDFSGYSDIAVGTARVFGFELTRNFERPYASRSIAEFWRRWHISLSNWLRDYLYMPLALSGGGATRNRLYFSLFITFVLIGLWHGANWTFIALGATHGIYLVFGQISKPYREKIAKYVGLVSWPRCRAALQVVTTFALVAVSWVFFRAPSLPDALYIISNLPAGFLGLFDVGFVATHLLTTAVLGTSVLFLALRLFAVVFMEVVEFLSRRETSLYAYMLRLPTPLRLGAYQVVFLWILMLGYFGEKMFIYFQF